MTTDGVTHAVQVQGATVFEAAAAGIAQFQQEGWIETVPSSAVIRVEVQLAPIVHDVPMKSLERWAKGPSTSPKHELLKRAFRK